jgi:hypothetical protein
MTASATPDDFSDDICRCVRCRSGGAATLPHLAPSVPATAGDLPRPETAAAVAGVRCRARHLMRGPLDPATLDAGAA